jgi:uncharacterized protein (TIGR01777 family)
MHVLITGGTGLIGTATCALLREQGHRVTILSRSARRSEPQLAFIKKLSDCDPTVDAVVNLAGAGLADKRWSRRYKREIISSRVLLTQRLVEWMGTLEVSPKRLISASAIGYYGASETMQFVESSPGGKGFSAELCQDWEMAANEAAALGIPVTVLRLGVVFARSGGALEKMTQSFRFGVESWLGSGSQWLSWVHLDDVVRAINHALTAASPSPIYNVVAPQALRHRDLAEAVGRFHRVWLRLGVPAAAAKLLAGQMAEELLLTGQCVLPRQLEDEGFDFHFPTVTEALKDLARR